MVLAHVKGLLRPGYKHGRVSRAAENMVLSAVAAELTAEQIRWSAADSAALYAVVKPGKLEKYHAAVRDDLIRAAFVARLDVFAPKQPSQRHSEFDALAKLYYALQKADITKLVQTKTDPQDPPE
jgi:hypothetical protein